MHQSSPLKQQRTTQKTMLDKMVINMQCFPSKIPRPDKPPIFRPELGIIQDDNMMLRCHRSFLRLDTCTPLTWKSQCIGKCFFQLVPQYTCRLILNKTNLVPVKTCIEKVKFKQQNLPLQLHQPFLCFKASEGLCSLTLLI